MTNDYDPLAVVQAAGPPGSISFVYGLPDPETFPVDAIRACLDKALRDTPSLVLQYGSQQGYGPLIDALRDRFLRQENLLLERPQITLTGGSTQALDHLCTLLTRAGDRILVEAPTYFESLQLFHDHGLVTVQVPVDRDGICVDALAERLATPASRGETTRLLYLIPNFQNPSGSTLSRERRSQLLELADRSDLLIIEDDVYHELYFEEEPPPPSLFALDGGRRIFRIGSFSKILAPALRLGWLMGPDAQISRLVNSGLRNMGGGANPLISNALAGFLQQGLLGPHIERLRNVYGQRKDRALAALQASMPSGVRWNHPRGGFFIWLTLPDPLSSVSVAERASEQGIVVLPGDPFFAETPLGQHMRLSYSFVPPADIHTGVAGLARVIRSMSGR